MAKFIITVDTDNKTFDVKKDSESIDADSFSVGSYECCSYDHDDCDQCYLSYSQKDEDGVSVTSHSVCFHCADDQKSVSVKLDGDLSKAIKKTVSNYIIANKLSQILSKEK